MTTIDPQTAPSTLTALLRLQDHDTTLVALETRASEIAGRRAALDAEREGLERQAHTARAAADAEHKRHREISLRLAGARVELDKRKAAQDAAVRLADVTAAVAAVEESKRQVATLEGESIASRKRSTELAGRAQQLEARVAAALTAHATVRTALDAEEAELEVSLGPSRETRRELAAQVPADILSSYDRVRRKRAGAAVVAMRGQACSACDTAIPLQRHRQVVANGSVAVCEGCGVLLHAGH